MQTQSEIKPILKTSGVSVTANAGQWAPETKAPRRSLFPNYNSASQNVDSGDVRQSSTPELATIFSTLQAGIDAAVGRSFIYRLLAKAFEDATTYGWALLSQAETHRSLRAAIQGLGPARARLDPNADQLLAALQPDRFEAFFSAYLSAFGHAARGRCPLNEIEYGELKADALFQPHRLADLAAFYRAFGLDLAPDADERHDHICLELEFMCVLAAKEAYALEHQLGPEELETCRVAQKKFLREHLGRWTPAFARRLAQMAAETPLYALAAFLESWIESECALFGVTPGNHELSLRPVDESAESLCASCNLSSLPPGAVPAPSE